MVDKVICRDISLLHKISLSQGFAFAISFISWAIPKFQFDPYCSNHADFSLKHNAIFSSSAVQTGTGRHSLAVSRS